jgi:hypothetical protein
MPTPHKNLDKAHKDFAKTKKDRSSSEERSFFTLFAIGRPKQRALDSLP